MASLVRCIKKKPHNGLNKYNIFLAAVGRVVLRLDDDKKRARTETRLSNKQTTTETKNESRIL